MSDKKHIDRLFQEKLKNFEATPDDAIWNNIHDRLHRDKRKRRVIPIWWRVAGVAALITLIFTFGVKVMSDDYNTDSTNPTVDTESQVPNNSNESILSDSKNLSQPDSNSSDEFKKQMDNTSDAVTANDYYSEGISNDTSSKASSNASYKNRVNQKSTIISSSEKAKIADNHRYNPEDDTSQEKLLTDKNLNSSSKEEKSNNTNEAVVNVSKKDNINSEKNNLDTNSKSEIDKLIKDSKNTSDSKVANASEKIESIISEENKEDAEKDKSIEDAIADANTEDDKEKDKKLNRWNISPNVAPVYFSSLGQGSTLDEQFANNDKSSEVTMSYGVGGSYAINKKLKVRAGINKVDMSYSTNNVIAFKNIDVNSRARSQMANVSMNNNANNLTFLSTESLNKSSTPEIINSKSEGSLAQRFGFIEIPMEVEYALINNKLGVNVIGGFSTLIVDNNEILSVVNGSEMQIGEANNINNMSYSANFGLGINYHISQKIKVNVEPTFKYQINTFSNSSGDFQPYFIGVYTGLSYKF